MDSSLDRDPRRHARRADRHGIRGGDSFAQHGRARRSAARDGHRAVRRARRGAGRTRHLRGANDVADLDVHAQRDPRSGGRNGHVRGDQPGRRARAVHSAGPCERDAPAGTGHARDGAVRDAGRVPDHVSRVLRHRAPYDGGPRDRGATPMSAVVTATPRAEGARTAAMVDFRTENRLTATFVVVGLVALFGGAVTGLLQALEHAGVQFPGHVAFVKSYYHSVAMHGVLNVLVWTTFFISGFVPFIVTRALGRPLASRPLGWATFALMVGGLVVAAIPLVGNAATVMFTFYPPLLANWAFYVGLTPVVVGTWLITLNLALTLRGWWASHPGVRTPLPAFMGMVTFAMWTIASLGLAAEMLFMLIPWSLGWVSGTDPLLARVLFWFTGHPIVYFWLLPAYMSWYTLMPRQVGGRLFSDPLARASFILFLVLSTPLGFHHQFTDPGIHEGWKLVHAFLTFAVFFPRLLTFFDVVASLEDGARHSGGRGWVAWFLRLPWGDPSVAAQIGAMLTFAFGGMGGLVNASFSLNLPLHQ